MSTVRRRLLHCLDEGPRSPRRKTRRYLVILPTTFCALDLASSTPLRTFDSRPSAISRHFPPVSLSPLQRGLWMVDLF